MKVKYCSLLMFSLLMVGCNSDSVNKPKSPFNDTYTPIGMKSEYGNPESIDSEDYSNLRTSIDNVDEIDNNDKYIVSSYNRVEESRDLKAAYFGKNLGATNLCSLTHIENVNTRFSNNVTTKFQTTHKEEQNLSGGINKSNPIVNDYIFENEKDHYKDHQQTWNDNEEKVTKLVKEGDISSETSLNDIFGLKTYKDDIKNNFGKIEKRGKEIEFNVLGKNNDAVYGKLGDKYLIREAASLYSPFSTTVGDTYKAVNNFFYEALLEKVDVGEGKYKFRFTNFRFYMELLILSEAISDESKVPVLYLEKPQLVEYSEIKFTINYASKLEELPEFKGEIPEPTNP